MKKLFMTAFLLLVMLSALVFAAAYPGGEAQALPEYSAQTGEPCASCHISPSGGGPRGPRGQAWVGGGKPGEVPGTIEALELLGIHLTVDESQFLPSGEAAVPAQPLQISPGRAAQAHDWLKAYEGN